MTIEEEKNLMKSMDNIFYTCDGQVIVMNDTKESITKMSIESKQTSMDDCGSKNTYSNDSSEIKSGSKWLASQVKDDDG